MKPTCDSTCPKYNKGGIGERFCSDGLFDERVKFKRPRLQFGTMAVITPYMCSRSKKKVMPWLDGFPRDRRGR